MFSDKWTTRIKQIDHAQFSSIVKRMATSTFGGSGVPMELSVSDAIYALSDIIEAYQSPSHVGLLETFRKEHGGNMIKRMQIVYPAAIKLQAQVNVKKCMKISLHTRIT